LTTSRKGSLADTTAPSLVIVEEGGDGGDSEELVQGGGGGMEAKGRPQHLSTEWCSLTSETGYPREGGREGGRHAAQVSAHIGDLVLLSGFCENAHQHALRSDGENGGVGRGKVRNGGSGSPSARAQVREGAGGGALNLRSI